MHAWRRVAAGLSLLLVAFGAAVSAPATKEAVAAAVPATQGAQFRTSETISRPYVHDGTAGVDTRTVSLSVSNTQDLRGRQEITVSWSGAHPTGGIVANPNSSAGEQEEYPMVLLECRGAATGSDPVSPESCWTQDWNSRYEDSLTGNRDGDWPAYRLDQYETQPGAPIVGAPASVPASCRSLETAPVQYWVPWEGQSGTVYDGGLGGSCGEPPEATDAGSSALPSNEVYGVTGTDGTGSSSFDILTAAENATLGCSQTVACSLVAIPIMGIACDPAVLGPAPAPVQEAALDDCEDTGYFEPGSLQSSQSSLETETTVSGRLWWSPSNWNHRIVVPLTFAPPADSCSVVGSGNSVQVYGSELMLQATAQWAPTFCLNTAGGFSFVHVAEGEPEARNQVATGASVAAFTSYAQPLGYGRPVVNAPVAVTGFAISFLIDGANGDPVTSLRLTPLLLAKLLTESYPALTPGQGGDPALAKNPLDIAQDPEFIALNPGIAADLPNTVAASELVSLSSDSDVVEALTSYIEADPAARSFLDGVPDTSMPGEYMVVNPAYKGINLPVDQWPLLSTYQSNAFDNNATNAPCLQANPQPLESLIASPLPTLEEISLNMQFAKANSTMTCSSTGADGNVNSMVANGTETPGHRFLIGVTPLADDYRYGLTPAELQTTDGSFVLPDDASLESATTLLKPDTSTDTWPVPYSDFEKKEGAASYPGTMIVYAAVPTAGLTEGTAADLASLLRFAAGSGQTPGSGSGELPAGYLPMVASDGLGALAAYTLAAATDVAAQNGQIPPLTSNQTAKQTSNAEPTGSAAPTVTDTGVSSTESPASPESGTSASTKTTAVGGQPLSSTGLPNLTRSVPATHYISALGVADPRLWLTGVPVSLIVGLSLGGAAGTSLLLLVGRRYGRW